MMTLLEILKQKQGTQVDHDFAKRLGVARSYWSETRRGVKPVGLAILRGVVRAYPELYPEVIAFLRDGND